METDYERDEAPRVASRQGLGGAPEVSMELRAGGRQPRRQPSRRRAEGDREAGREYPFSPLGAPVEIAAVARRVPEWPLVDGSAGPLPQSPVTSSASDETITLVPYGSAKLRVTAFPTIRP